MSTIDKARVMDEKESMIQIIGTLSSKDTQKAIRYMKERRKEFQFVDLEERRLSKKEWESIFSSISGDEFIDKDSKYYTKNGYSYREYDPREEVQEHPELLKLPVLRNRSRAAVGFDRTFMEENS